MATHVTGPWAVARAPEGQRTMASLSWVLEAWTTGAAAKGEESSEAQTSCSVNVAELLPLRGSQMITVRS